MATTEDSFDYSSVVIPIVLAGYNLGIKATPEFGQGAADTGSTCGTLLSIRPGNDKGACAPRLAAARRT